jgi:ABC-type branched-subunit amino acid transport system substrate-binding protein
VRRRGALPALIVLALLPGCGQRLDSGTRQTLLQNELRGGGSSVSGTTGGLGDASTSGAATTGGSGAVATTGTTGGTTSGTTGPAVTTGGTTSGTSSTTGAAASPPPGGNGGATDIGVTATSVTVGTVVDQSGPRPGLFNGSLAGVRAYFAYVNSQGGVYGRKLQTASGDSGTACNQTASAHQGLGNKVLAFVGSFGVYDNCGAPFFASNPGIADVSYAISSERGAVKNNFSTQLQSAGAQAGPALLFKAKFPGIEKKVGALIADVAASRSARANLKSMYQQLGFTLVYEQFVSPTEVDFTRYVIGMRQKGVDMAVLTNDISGEVKFVNAAQQQGWTPHVITTRAVFYDPAFKDLASGNPTNVFSELGSALYFNKDERNNPGVALYQDWMDKTAPDQAKDSFSVFGWTEAQLFVEALKKAGPKATRPTLLAALRSIHSLDTLGLLPSGDPASKKPTPCFIIGHWDNGTWKRWNSPANGFDCSKPFVYRK